MKILFVIPSWYEEKTKRVERLRFPFGRLANPSVTQVAACTPPHHEIDVVDDHFEEPNYDGDWDLVGITSMTSQSPRAFDIAKEFRKRGFPVVMGGFHVTTAPEDAEGKVDSIVIGEAEISWPILLEDFEKGELKPSYQAEKLVPAEDIPPPRYDILRKKGYYYHRYPIQVSRGCPLTCRFCSVIQFYKRSYRTKPVESIIKELENVGSSNVFFSDDNMFIARKSYLFELFKAIEPMGLSWCTQGDMRSVDNDELLAAAAKAGCTSILLGVESLTAKGLDQIDKNRSNKIEEYSRIIEKIHSYGIGVVTTMIMGLDGDSPETWEPAVEFFESNRVEEFGVYQLIPLPATPMAEDLRRDGRVIDNDYGHYSGIFETVTHPNYKPGEMQSLYWKIYQRYYSLRSIWKRFSLREILFDRERMFLFLHNLLVIRFHVYRRQHPNMVYAGPTWINFILYNRLRWNEYRNRSRSGDAFPSGGGAQPVGAQSEG